MANNPLQPEGAKFPLITRAPSKKDAHGEIQWTEVAGRHLVIHRDDIPESWLAMTITPYPAGHMIVVAFINENDERRAFVKFVPYDFSMEELLAEAHRTSPTPATPVDPAAADPK